MSLLFKGHFDAGVWICVTDGHTASQISFSYRKNTNEKTPNNEQQEAKYAKAN
jgi:hypothetical protein